MISDRTALLAAVASDPDDDLPRLVYADWLDEHGEADRAEFIRLQCHTARVGVTDPSWAPGKLREYDLFKANEAGWRPGKPDDISFMLMHRWRRGFPACVALTDVATGKLTAGEWCNGAFEVSAHTSDMKPFDPLRHPWPAVGPVRELSFSGWQQTSADLLRCDRFRTTRELSLIEWYAAVNAERQAEFLRAVAELPADWFPELRTLHILSGNLNRAALEALTNAPALAGVTRFDLSFDGFFVDADERITPDCVAALAARIAPRTEMLELKSGGVNLLRPLAAVRWPNLRSLWLYSTRAEELELLATADMPRLTVFHTYFARPAATDNDTWAEAFAAWPALRGVTQLSLGGWPAGGVRRFLRGLSAQRFDTLGLFSSNPTDSPFRFAELADHPAVQGLKATRWSFPAADVGPLADPTVLPELHSIWLNEAAPPPRLNWRGGERTVFTREHRDVLQRPSRYDWTGRWDDDR